MNNQERVFYWAVGRCIAERRYLMRMSQKILGDRINRTRQTVSEIERGMSRIELNLLNRIAIALNTTIRELLK